MALASAEMFGHSIALIDDRRRWTYTELGTAVRGAIAAATALGIAKGDRVGLWGPNTSEWIFTALGILGAGGIRVCRNRRGVESDSESQVAHVRFGQRGQENSEQRWLKTSRPDRIR